jgi:hypothetical protein
VVLVFLTIKVILFAISWIIASMLRDFNDDEEPKNPPSKDDEYIR